MSGGSATPSVLDVLPVDDEVTSQAPYVRELGGLPAVGEMVSGGDHFYAFYAEVTPKGETLPEFLDRGGLLFSWNVQEANAPSLYEVMVRDFGEEVTKVEVGSVPGVVSLDDPVGQTEVRPHRVTWSTGGLDFVVVADQPGEKVLNLARSIACG